MTETATAPPRVAPGAGRPGAIAAFSAVYTGQIARARVARGPLLFVASLQSLGILLLLRGVVHNDPVRTTSAIVAGSTVLVVAFVALNLLAQRFGALKASRALDYYGALPVTAAPVVLGTAASYATFTIPGAVLTCVVGIAMYGLSFAHVWLVVPVVVAAGVALSGLGAAMGLLAPRSELATVLGQLAMTAVLFLGVIPPAHLPAAARAAREVVPSMTAVDALAAGLRGSPTWWSVGWRLGVSVLWGIVGLVVAARAFRRACAR
ncbi:MAG TPA: ABC transporter permease [Mycobacteriales bacterium]|nr:ABC transporter permease [Mycobacteriales bacterium]